MSQSAAIPVGLLALTFATAAVAGPIEIPPPTPPVVVPVDEPFEGPYVGVEFGFGHGEGTETPPVVGATRAPDVDLDYDGGVYGLFAGYNFQNGSLVYGGEIRYLHGNINDDATGFDVDSVLDLRARVGFAASQRVLVYGAAGYSIAQAAAAADFDMTGFNYGIGAEYNVNDSFFLGIDLTGRDLEGDQGGFDYDGTVNTATLRLGFRF